MATIIDVARLAGVSIKTVSRVINRESSIRPETLAKVERAIDQLGYKPHRGARMMRSAKSGLIGIVTGLFSRGDQSASDAGLSDVHLIRGANRVCREAGKTLLMADAGGDAHAVVDLLNTFASHQVEGVIYAAPFHQQVLVPKPQGVPLVLVNCFDAYGTPAVLPDDAVGQSRAVEYLIAQGHRRIAYVGLSEEIVAGRLRKAAFLDTCRLHGLNPDDCPALAGSSMDPHKVFAPLAAALQQMLARRQKPTALCLGNDVMALHAIRHLEGMGLRLPDDLALMGYDNDVALCTAMRPTLSTVTLPYEEMGEAAVRLLIREAGEPAAAGPSNRLLLAGSVVCRDSTPSP